MTKFPKNTARNPSRILNLAAPGHPTAARGRTGDSPKPIRPRIVLIFLSLAGMAALAGGLSAQDTAPIDSNPPIDSQPAVDSDPATESQQETTVPPGSPSDSTGKKRPTPRVTRARRPIFAERDWDGIYFENLFREGLVGPRPASGSLTEKTAGGPEAKGTGGETGTEPPANGQRGWAEVISGEAIENEVKRLQLQLEQDITTPVKFKTDYLKVRQTYSLLSMWFAIIHEYPDSVRWKQYAASVQPACWRAAAAARTDSDQAFQSARLRKEELQEMIRGGAFTDTEKPVERIDWSQVVDRVPTMTHLEASLADLKLRTASAGEFKSNTEEIFNQASAIAAIGRVLAQEEMEGGDDEDYRGLSQNMTASAMALIAACQLNDFESAAQAVNKLEQSCNKCHEDWR